MTEIKVGDRVTWRTHPNSIGIAGCVVKELETDPDHGECAKLEHWLFKAPYSNAIPEMAGDGTTWAKVDQLERE